MLPISDLSPRDIAAIEANPWRELLNAGESGEITAEMQQMLEQVMATEVQAMGQAGQAKEGLFIIRFPGEV